MRAIILKKTPFSEANEILTMYTRELGKVRAVARAVKSPKSKMAYALQPLFLSDVEILQSRKMPSVIKVKPLETFKNLHDDLPKIYAAMFATELILRSTPDEQENAALFDLYLEFLEHLNSKSSDQFNCTFAFGIKAMALNGYAIRQSANSMRHLPKSLVQFAAVIEDKDFSQVDLMQINQQEIKKDLNNFISNILERKINSTSFV